MGAFGRWLGVFLAAVLAASVLSAPPVAAQDERPVVTPADESEGPLPEVDDDPVAAISTSSSLEPLVIPEPEPSPESGRDGWGTEIAAARATPGARVDVGASPVSVEMVAAPNARAAVPEVAAVANVLPASIASDLSPFDAAVSLSFLDDVGSQRSAPSTFELTFDLSDVSLGDAPGSAERLTMTRFVGCEVFEGIAAELQGEPLYKGEVAPSEIICDGQDRLEGEFDSDSREFTVVVDEAESDAEIADRQPAVAANARAAAVGPKAGRVRVQDATAAAISSDVYALAAIETPSPEVEALVEAAGEQASEQRALQNTGGGATLFALASSSATSTGDYADLPVPRLSDTTVGLFSGSAEVSYPIPAPAAAAGPSPSVAFVYSSANVDGLIMNENTQVSALGVGWNLAGGGSINRSLEACNITANNVNAVEDKCLDDDPDEAYSLSLAGHSSRLVRVDTTAAYPHEFRLESDPFWRIRLWRGTPAAAAGQTLDTPDEESEWWSVETPDGTVYTFGTTQESVDWVPVYLASDASACTSTATGQDVGFCDRAYQWSLDTVTDTFGNQMVYEYNQELNYYAARGDNAYRMDYVRASRLEAIEYGANPSQNRPANARIDLQYEWRCASSQTFSKCTEVIPVDSPLDPDDPAQDRPTQMYDVPLEFWCGPLNNVSEYVTLCTEVAPTFWSQMRLTGAISQVGAGTDGADGWVTVANHDPGQSYVRDETASFLDSSLQPVIDRIRERPIEGVAGPGNIGEYEDWGFAPLYAPDFDESGGTIASGDLIVVDDAHDVGTVSAVASVHDEDWITFEDVYIGDPNAPADEFVLRASAFQEGTVEVWIDADMPDFGQPYGTQPSGGTKIGEVTFGANDLTVNRRDFQTFVIPVTPTSGVHDVSLRATNGDQNFFTFWNWGRFATPSISDIPEVGEVRFRDAAGWAWHDNRLNHTPATGASSMRFPRMKTFINQLAGRVDYEYGQSPGQTCTAGVSGIPMEVGSSWATNRTDCFAQFDDSTGADGEGFTIFYRWPVLQSTRSGQVTAAAAGGFEYSPDVTTTYIYDNAGWGAVFDGSLFNDFRGYQKVQVTDDAGTTEHRFHQGLKGESASGVTSPYSTVTRSDGTVFQDDYWLEGLPYETRRIESPTSTNSLTRQWTEYVAEPTVSTLTDREDPRFVAPDKSHSFTNPNAAFTFYAENLSEYSYNDWGQVESTLNLGRPSITSDDQSIDTNFYPATDTNQTLGTWRGEMPCATGVDKSNTAQNPATPAAYQRWSITFYDGNTTPNCAAAVDEPVPTGSAVPRWASTSEGSLLRTEFELDQRGRVVSVTGEKDAAQSPPTPTSQTTYHPYHGQVTTAKNDLLWESVVQYDRWRRPFNTIDVNNRETSTSYDEYSRVLTITEPAQQLANVPTVKLTYEQDVYPAYVQTETILDGSDYTNSASFVDGFGRSILTQTMSSNTNELWATASAYDSVGRTYRASAQFGVAGSDPTTFNNIDWGTVDSFTETEYDAQSRVKSVRTKRGDGTGNQTVQFWEEEWRYNHYWTTYYDRKDQRTLTLADGRGRTVRTRELAAGTGGANIDTVFIYNGADDLTHVRGPEWATTGEQTLISYDRAGRKTKLVDPDSGEWRYFYDTNSNLTIQRDPSGTDLNFLYDDLDRQIRTRYREGPTGSWTNKDWYWYDPAGNLGALRQTRATNDNDGADEGLVQRIYTYENSTGRLTSERTQIPRNTSTLRWSFDTDYTFRDDGQVATVKYPTSTGGASNETVTYGYDTSTGVATGLSSTSHGVIVDDVTWNSAGQTIERVYGASGASGVATFQYDPNTLRLTTNQAGTVANPAAWQDLQYRYDKNDNITRIGDGANANQWQCFAYDTIDRLTRAWTASSDACATGTTAGVGNYDESYAYSNGGNITSRAGADYTYGQNGAANHAVTSIVDGAATSTFAYNTDGNMETRSIAGQPAQTLSWDQEQTLDIVDDGTNVTNMMVDADGARVRRDDGTIFTYYLPGGHEYERVGNSGTFTHYYTIGGAMVAFAEVGDDPTFIFSDHINSTTVTNDGTGPQTQRYTPWGETRTDGGLATDHTYTGQIDDQTTGLKYFNARYYDPISGRFISPDTIMPNIGDGQSVNRFTYGNNNPVLFNDPTGLCSAYLSIPCSTGDEPTTTNVSGTSFDEPETISLAQAESRRKWSQNSARGSANGIVNAFRSDTATVYLTDKGAADSAGYNCYVTGCGDSITVAVQRHQIVRGADPGYEAAYEQSFAMAKGATEELLISAVTGLSGRALSRARHLCSFSADTEVLMADGSTKPISEVEVGELVLAQDPETGERGQRVVTRLWVHQDTIIDLSIGGYDVATTEDHPFWNQTDSEWQRADALNAGDMVLTAEGNRIAVDAMKSETARTAAAHNLTVDEIHTFFVIVGSHAVLVHNVCGPAVTKYEVGLFDDLQARSVVGDGLDIHHVPQKAPARSVIDGYDSNTAPSIAVPNAEHRLINKAQSADTGVAALSARQLLARDIWHLRRYTAAPNPALRQLISLNKHMYPGSF